MSIPKAGAKVRASDWSSAFPTDLDAWATYTPTLTQSVAVTKTVNRASYTKTGRTVKVNGFLSITSAGTVGNNVVVGLPVAPVADLQLGNAYILDTSTSTRYQCSCLTFSGALIFQSDQAGGSGHFGVNPAIALANGDQIAYEIEYEAAS